MNMDRWISSVCGKSGVSEKCSIAILWLMPSSVLLTVFSVFYIFNHFKNKCNIFRSWTLTLRTIFVSALAVCPVVKLSLAIFCLETKLELVDYLMTFFETLSWTLLMCYLSIKPRAFTRHQEQVYINLCVLLCFSSTIRYIFFVYQQEDLVGKWFTPLRLFLISLYFGSLLLKDEVQASEYNRLQSPLFICNDIDSSMSAPSEDVMVHRQNYISFEQANVWSKTFFSWIGPLLAKGSRACIQSIEDLCELPLNIQASVIAEELHSSTGYSSGANCEKPKESLIKMLHHTFGTEYYSIGILKLLSDVLAFGGPMLLNLLVNFLENGAPAHINGYYYALMLFCTTFFGALSTVHYNYLIQKVALKIRAAIITTVYKKTMNVSQNVLSVFSTGEIMNFMSSDTDRIVNFCQSFHQFWSLPLQVAVTLYLLHQQIGVSFAVGLGFAISLIPVNQVIAKKIGSYSELMMREKDRRIKLMSEVLGGMKVIKMHAWENLFSTKINVIRKKEMKYLKKRKYLDAFCVYFWATSPVVVTFLSFTVYALLGNDLTASKIFTSLALFNMLIVPLNAFPWVINGLVEAHISLKRVQKFLQLPELKLEDYYLEPENDHVKLQLSDGIFTSNISNNDGSDFTPSKDGRKEGPSTSSERREDFQLGPLSLNVNEGSLVCVVGKVGSGKSTLISSVLGNVKRISGKVYLSNSDWTKGIGLVTQVPWIQKTSIRDNILFGKDMDGIKYAEVLKACALDDDLKMFQLGDKTEVGEKGFMLSGGQKARIALARAIYQDYDLYLLDDPFSAVDVHVAEHLLDKCIFGLLKHKTRILCTHRLKLLEKADIVVLMSDGKILKQGPPKSITELNFIEFDDSSKDIESSSAVPASSAGIQEVQPCSASDPIDAEGKDSGVVKLQVYKYYWASMGFILCLLLLLSCFFMQASKSLSDWWLTIWIAQTHHNGTNFSTFMYENEGNTMLRELAFFTGIKFPTTYLVVYSSLAIFNNFSTIIRSFLFAYCGIKAASVIHNRLEKHVLKAPVKFFCETSLGRIVNRFSSDVYNIDDSLPFMLNILLAQTYSLIGCLIVTVYSLPWLINLFIPLSMIYYSLQSYYRCTSRELKRLASVSLSPVYTHFSETLYGHTTIKAFASNQRFQSESNNYLDANQRAMFSSIVVAQWLNLRLQLIGVVVVTSIAIIALLQNKYGHVEPGLVGLALSYALLVTGLLNGFVTAFTETEKEMVSVERVMQYINNIAVEKNEGIQQLPFKWPSHGVVTFRGVSLKYKDDDVCALDNVSFQTRPAEKIGIVGRTGSGKSSLLQALFRIIDINEGQILIDGVDISELHLQTLRSFLALVPQDPFLFSGTVRENVDPGDVHSDSEIWNALRNCYMDHRVKDLGGLNAEVTEKGENFSSGEKQLLCLARIILCRKKVLCLDEATASVDQQTDSLVQLSLRMAFRDATVLIIAHRIESVMDCDRIIVMNRGQIQEIGEPSLLLRNSSSEFYKLVYKSQ